MPVDALLDGAYHNQPSDLVVDRAHRIYFADPRHAIIPFGPAIFPFLDHCSVLRLERNDRRAWVASRVTYDTVSPRAVLLAPDEKTLFVADGEPTEGQTRELRAYPLRDDLTVDHPVVLHTFGADHRGPHRGIEGMCLDAAGNIVAVAGWRRSGPGPLVYVFSPQGVVIESHPFPADLPGKCCFGGSGLEMLFVTTAGGELYRAKTDRRGA
jgi:gluconolactonase